MTLMLTTADAAFDVALALTALLAVSAQDPLWLWERAHSRTTQRRWWPWLVLAALAIASSAYGILHPAQFAAAAGDGMLDPGSFTVALSQL